MWILNGMCGHRDTTSEGSTNYVMIALLMKTRHNGHTEIRKSKNI